MKKRLLFLTAFVVALCSMTTFAQTISGKITDSEGGPLVGASILVKGTKNGTVTDANGGFALNNVPKGSTLVASFVGYINKEVSADGNLNISLVASDALDEVVVTGVFDTRKRLDASISITTLNSQQLSRLAPASAADLLRNVSGVFVNSSLGETRNTVTTRGLSTRAGYNFDKSGLNYVSMQEDGLPVTNIIFNYFTPDIFLRTDASTGKLEAVRGGTASIVGANAPGGIFNYISKTGGATFGGEFRPTIILMCY